MENNKDVLLDDFGQLGTGNVSVHLMCRSNDSLATITEVMNGFPSEGSENISYVTRVDPGGKYFMVSD